MDISGVYYCSKCMLQMEEDGACPHCGYDPDKKEIIRKHLEEGCFLNDRYLLGSVIGSGGFGITYAAWDTLLDMPVAIKEYFPRDFADRDVRDGDEVLVREKHETEYKLGLRRFIQESRVLAMFSQVPGIVNVSDCFEENETFYFVMEYVRGVPLDVYAQEHKLDAKQLLGMMRGVIDALEAVHAQGVLHRDITPKNLMVLEDGSVKLIDFGAARKMDREGSVVIVTEHYAPVEQYDNTREQGPWTDIYSLCATMYEMLTAVVPKESLARKYRDELKTPSSLGIHLKKYQESALMAGLTIEPEKRIRSIAELRSRLYNLPLPEEIRRRKAFMRKVSAISTVVFAICVMLVINFTTGLPLHRGLMFSLMPDGWHILGCHTNEEEYVIPAGCFGISISTIGPNAFSDADMLRSVEIPGSIKEIGEQAFFGCDKLERIIINEGVERISNFAFAQNSMLREIQLPESLEYMAADALNGTAERLRIWGKYGGYVEDYANTYHYVLLNRDNFTTEETSDGLKITDCSFVADTVYFPDYIDGVPVVALQEKMFDHNEIQTICKIVLPDPLTILPQICDTRWGDHVEIYYDFGNSLSEIGANALRSHVFEDLALPEGLKVIASNAFSNSIIESIKLPDGLTTIGSEAFSATEKLKEIKLPDSLTEIGEGIFSTSELENISIPSGITAIPDRAFSGCYSLRTVEIPATITAVGDYAFASCNTLEYLALPGQIKNIGCNAFLGCENLVTVHISSLCPDLLIEDYSFGTYLTHTEQSGPAGLEYLYLPDGTTSIGSAFIGCLNLQMIRIPESVSFIADDAFVDCSSNLIVVGKSGSYVHSYALLHNLEFEDEDSWISVEDAYEYNNEKGIPEIHISEFSFIDGEEAIMPSFYNGYAVTEIPYQTMLQVQTKRIVSPVFLKNLYFAPSSAEFGGIADPPCEELILRGKYLQNLSYLEGSNINEICIPDKVKTIGTIYAPVKKLELPESVESIADLAFAYCDTMEEIELPKKINYMGYGIFDSCSSLKKVNIPDGCKNVCCMFAGCTNLQTAILPESVREINRCAFVNCTSLQDVWIYNRNAEFNMTGDTDNSHFGYIYSFRPDFDYYTDDPAAVLEEIFAEELQHPFVTSLNVTLHGYAGSTTEDFCREWGLNFEPIPE